MDPIASTIAPVQDRRALRSRAALMQAAVALVTERDTTAVPVSAIAEAAQVTRAVLYLQFGDRDTLILEAALDLIGRDLIARIPSPTVNDGLPTLTMAEHFALHRPFYRAIITGSCGYAFTKAMNTLILPVTRQLIGELYADHELPAPTLDDLTVFMAGGSAAIINTWLVDAADPLDPQQLADRLGALLHVLTHRESLE